MTKAGFLWLLVLVVVSAGKAAAGSEVCADLQSRLAALEVADRDQWESQGEAADPYAIERQRLAVLKALAVNRCRGTLAKRDRQANRFLAGLFGNKRPFLNGAFRKGGLFGNGIPGNDFSFGTFRTLCVRTCDGYYFPISFSAAGPELQRDEMACRALCPGQAVSLYVQRSGEGEGGAMMSLAGEPYTALPAAFRYRREYDRGCACGAVDARMAEAFRAFAVPPPMAAASLQAVEAGGPPIPVPPARVREDDPDTAANRAGGFIAAAAGPEAAGQVIYGEGPGGKVVRMVGPAPSYLGD